MRNPDPDAQLIMSVLLASPRAGDPAALLAAARAYEAVCSARDAGRLDPLDLDKDVLGRAGQRGDDHG